VLVELILVVESLVAVLTFERLVEVTGEDVGLVVSDRDHGITVWTFLRHEILVNMGGSVSDHGVFLRESFATFWALVDLLEMGTGDVGL